MYRKTSTLQVVEIMKTMRFGFHMCDNDEIIPHNQSCYAILMGVKRATV